MLKKVLGVALAIALAATCASAAYTPGPLPAGTFGGGTIPQNDDVFKAERKAAAAGAKLARAVAKCYSKGAKSVSKGSPDGVAVCIGIGNPNGKGAADKYAKTIAGLLDLPSCHDYLSDAALIASNVKVFQPGIYCTSPSSAFLDGTDGF
jgi:hypothetical protein